MYLVRKPLDRYEVNCLDVIMLLHGWPMLGHLEVRVAALLSPLMRDAYLEVSGQCANILLNSYLLLSFSR